MDSLQRSRPITRLISVGGFVALFVGGFLYFWTGSGGDLPGITDRGRYEVSFMTDDVKNLRTTGDVSIAGVIVGEVKDQTIENGKTRVLLSLDRSAAPLHEGATVRVGVKSIVGQSYVDVVDGKGPEIAEDSTLPDSAVREAVDIDELLATLDPKTRRELTGTVRSLGVATDGAGEDLSRLMSGLGDLGREGYTAVDAIAAQSSDLKAFIREATTLLDALDTGRGQIATVVGDARRLTEATSGQRGSIEDTMRTMPHLLASAKVATGRLGELSGSLAPVAADLRRAAPDLSTALVQVPAVSRDLRGLVPALDDTLAAAPATLDRVPTFSADVRAFIPSAQAALRDVNPMLAYLKPYGVDLGAMFASFGASMDVVAENGIRPIRVSPILNSRSFAGNPLPLTLDPLHWNNPYPKPGRAGDPAPFEGKYPRVERDPK